MAADPVANLVEALTRGRLLQPEQLQQLARAKGRFSDPRALAKELVQRGWLTPFQVNLLLSGRGKELVVGQYVLLHSLGEGGMGRVFKARHHNLGRIVALKVIRQEHLDDPEALHRFRREIRAVAQLAHPNVVAAFDADQVGDLLYLAMEYVEGVDLAQRLKEKGPLPIADACDYVRQAALALQHAHERGLVHRDIKPSNLLLTRPSRAYPRGQIKLLDLGVARLQSRRDDDSMVTQIGILVGTPDYMSPEQARNAHRADIRSDLYSLGCTFYTLLTGQLPFPGETATEKILKSCFDPPQPIAERRTDVPERVVAIVNKLMAKKPEDRYQTPAELAAALAKIAVAASATKPGSRWLLQLVTSDSADGSPRRPAGGPRRRLSFNLVGGGVLLALLALFTTLLWLGSSADADNPMLLGQTLTRQPFDSLLPRSIPAGERFPWQPNELVAVLGEQRGRHWGRVTCLAASPDGSLLASGGHDGCVRLWEVPSLRERAVLKEEPASQVHALAFAPDGRSLFYGCADGSLHWWDLTPPSPELRRSLPRHADTVYALAVSPDSSKLASGSGDNTVRVWDLTDDPPTFRGLTRHSRNVYSLAFSPNGRTLASGSLDATIRLWDLSGAAPRETAVLTGHESEVTALAFAPPGGWLVSGGDDHTVRLWNLGQKQPTSHVLTKHRSVRALEFDAAGSRLAVAGYSGAQLWNWQGRDSTAGPVLQGGLREFVGLAFVPHSTLLAGGGEHRLQLYDLASANPQPLELPGVDISAVAVHPDGQTLITAGWHGGFGLWDLSAAEPLPTIDFPGHGQRIRRLQLTADGRTLVSVGQNGAVRLWSVSPRRLTERAALESYPAGSAARLDRAGQLLATPGRRSVRLWSLANQRPVSIGDVALPKADGDLRSFDLSPNGRTLASVDDHNLLRFWDVTGGKPRLRGRFSAGYRGGLPRFAPDSRTLAVAGPGGIRLWDLSSPEPRELPILQAAGSTGTAQVLVYSPDGGSLAAGFGQRLILWDVRSRLAIRDWTLPGPVEDLAFTADGRHLVTANCNGSAYVLRLAPAQVRLGP